MPAHDRRRLLNRIKAFAEDPPASPPWARPLTGRPELRIRQGEWRALVELDRAADTLIVLDIGHRREIYR